MTAVTIQSNKIVSNELRQLNTSRAILWKELNEPFGQPNKIGVSLLIYLWVFGLF